ncbi:DEAD/DEAH box helicase, partial [Bacillus sonorensis]
GTPAPNSLIDLWPQMYLLDQGERLGKTVTSYREKYFQPDKRNRTIIYSWKLRDGAEQSIHEKISDICISMQAKDWLDLPKR